VTTVITVGHENTVLKMAVFSSNHGLSNNMFGTIMKKFTKNVTRIGTYRIYTLYNVASEQTTKPTRENNVTTDNHVNLCLKIKVGCSTNLSSIKISNKYGG